MKNNIQLVKFVKTKIGTNYVYGMKGKVMTDFDFKLLITTYPNIIPESDKHKINTICVDCSGLISWYTGKVISSSQFKNQAKKVNDISTIHNAPIGVAVWRPGHIGVYIGNNEIIEARGHKYGVVKTNIKNRNFTHWFEIKDIVYEQKTTKKYNSIVDYLESKSIDSSFQNRKKIAYANGIYNYTGTYEQNINLLKILQNKMMEKN